MIEKIRTFELASVIPPNHQCVFLDSIPTRVFKEVLPLTFNASILNMSLLSYISRAFKMAVVKPLFKKPIISQAPTFLFSHNNRVVVKKAN